MLRRRNNRYCDKVYKEKFRNLDSTQVLNKHVLNQFIYEPTTAGSQGCSLYKYNYSGLVVPCTRDLHQVVATVMGQPWGIHLRGLRSARGGNPWKMAL
jgi:hypothetical protein